MRAGLARCGLLRRGFLGLAVVDVAGSKAQCCQRGKRTSESPLVFSRFGIGMLWWVRQVGARCWPAWQEAGGGKEQSGGIFGHICEGQSSADAPQVLQSQKKVCEELSLE